VNLAIGDTIAAVSDSVSVAIATQRLFMNSKAFVRSSLAQQAIEATPAPISFALCPGIVIYVPMVHSMACQRRARGAS
jgi:hypothetical protein